MRWLMVSTLLGLILIVFLNFSLITFAEEGKWTKKADMPTSRSHFSASALNEKIYAIGGSGMLGTVLSTVEEYDPLADTWTKKADMPTKRKWLSTSTVNGKIYAIGGSTNGIDPLTTVEEYDLGFVGLGIEAKEKVVTSWGKIKSNHENLKEREKARK